MTDIREQARQALDGITPGPWEVNTEGWAFISTGAWRSGGYPA